MRPEEEAPLTSEKEPVTEVQMDYREVYPAVTEPVQEEGEKGQEQAPPVEPAAPVIRMQAVPHQNAEPEREPEAEMLEKPAALEPTAEKPEAPVATPEQSRRQPARRPRHRYGFAAGVALLLLAVVGIVSLVSAVGNRIASAMQNDSELRAWDDFLQPVVLMDPAPFDEIAAADAGFLRDASVWDAASRTGEAETDALGRIEVPLTEAEASCKRLFGPQGTLQVGSGSFYTYDEEREVFLVAPIPPEDGYAPYTASVEKDGDTLRLTVGYVASSDEWRRQSGQSGQPSPVKYMVYEMVPQTNAEGYFISSVQAQQEEGLEG